MSDKQKIYRSSNDKDTFTNPALPNMIFKKVNGKNYVVSVCSSVKNKETTATANINIQAKNKNSK